MNLSESYKSRLGELAGIIEKKKYPSLSDVRSWFRNSLYIRIKKPILAAYIIGSEAMGTAKENSDLDIAVVITPVRGKNSIKFTENYHSKFPTDSSKPHWNGRRVDIQFFYTTDDELNNYSKIPLE